MFKVDRNKGFTLVELAIVIVVIGILVGMVAVAYTSSRDRARDASRINDAKVIVDALGLYNADNHEYPIHTSVNGDFESSNEDQPGDFLEALVEGGYLEEVPIDPINDNEMYYSYFRYGAGTSGCDEDKGRFFVFGIRKTESSDSRPDPSSPGWSCPNRDWHTLFDWVTGGYTN